VQARTSTLCGVADAVDVAITSRRDRSMLDVVGLGSALVDVIAVVDDVVVEKLGLAKGSMTLVDHERSAEVYGITGHGLEVSGGSAANTIAGVASLGGRAGFAGKVAQDRFGDVFRRDLEALSVELDLAVAHPGLGATGHCHVLVTPDAQRTMATHLGVANTLQPGDLDESLFSRTRIAYLEGYLFDLPPAKAAVRDVIDRTHGADGSVALSLSDSFCVERHRRDFLDLVTNAVDVVLANEDEARALFSTTSLDVALDAIEETGILAAVTRGPNGAVIVGPFGREAIDAEPVASVVDANGAGDLFAAGFVYALSQGADPVEAARLGAVCAAEVIGHLGARPQSDLAELATGAGLL
jgi:sugar/nucleoside kinase (ribokinase family)